MEPPDFLPIVRYMCDKPEMRTGSGSFWRVVMFLEGYALGVDLGKNEAHSKLFPFLTWVAGKREDLTLTWEAFRGLYDSDEEAIQNLKFLYIEFVAEYVEKAATE